MNAVSVITCLGLHKNKRLFFSEDTGTRVDWPKHVTSKTMINISAVERLQELVDHIRDSQLELHGDDVQPADWIYDVLTRWGKAGIIGARQHERAVDELIELIAIED